jgi:hypothetical protein
MQKKKPAQKRKIATFSLIFIFTLLISSMVIFGWYGIATRSVQDLTGLKNTAYQDFVLPPVKYALSTMSPLYIISALMVITYVSVITLKPKYAYQFIALFGIISGLVIWFYSII